MVDKSMMRRITFASLIGATIEWYDFFLYGVVAGLVFNKQFFPAHDPLVSTMLAYATFAVGFITRPLGGIIFGHFGDKIGRKSVLVATLMIMGGSTVLIGLLPTYNSVGIWAPILMLLLRVFQGIGLGGEWGGAVLMTYESAPKEKRAYYASLPQMGLSIGLTLSSGVVGFMSLFLTDTQFMAFGWRIAFVLSIFLVAVGMYIRLNIMESPEFQKLKGEKKEVKVPFLELWRGSTGNVIAGMGARFIDGVFFNIFGVFSINYLVSTLKVSRTTALMGVCVASIVMCYFIPFFGRMADRVGVRRLYLYGSIITGISSFPAFWLMHASGGNITLIWFSIIIPFGIFYAMIYAPEAALFANLFAPQFRYTGVSFVYQFSGIFASGITPMIATALLAANKGSYVYLCTYVTFAGIVSALSAAWLRRHQTDDTLIKTSNAA